MYHFNPIPDTELFEKMQTQYFYSKDDEYRKKRGMSAYVYWYLVENEAVNKANEKKHL